MTSPKRPAGFTLLELVVVLAILAILTGMAVASFTAVEDQARLDATTRQLDEAEIAVLGERNLRTANNQLLINGFVADVGRLPILFDHDSNTSTPVQPSELWLPPASVAAFAVRNASLANITSSMKWNGTAFATEPVVASDVDLNVLVPSGWRGPYLRMNEGFGLLRDGWGNPLIAFDTNGATLSVATDSLARLRTFGSNNAVGGTTTDELDRDLILQDTVQNKSLGTISVTLATGVTADEVRVYSPDPDSGKVRVYRYLGSSGTFVFANLPIGPKIVRAYTTAGIPASRLYSVALPFGGLPTLQLEN